MSVSSPRPTPRSRSSSRGPCIRPRPLEGALSPCSTPARDDLTKKQKVVAIKKALSEDPVDLATVRQLAISRGGLLNDGLRIKAWPKLLEVDVSNISAKPGADVLQAHRDYNQVVLDVNRSLKRFPPGMEEVKRMAMQDQLVDVIMWILVENPELHYYQGYHDICVTILLVVGEEVTFALMNKLSQQHLREFMDKTMERTKHMLNYMYPIVGRADPKLRHFMDKAEVGTIFSLSWLITWYGHVLGDFKNIVRLYDFFIACHPLMPIYVAAAIVLHRKEAILATECEMCYVHSLLSKIPPDMPFENIASHAGDLFCQFPPDELAREAEAEYLESQRINNLKDSELTPNGQQSKPNNRTDVAKRYSGSGSSASKMFRRTVWTLLGAVGVAVVAVYSNTYGWALFRNGHL